MGLSSCSRDCKPHKAQRICHLTLYWKVARDMIFSVFWQPLKRVSCHLTTLVFTLPWVQPHLLGFPHVAPNGWPILQSCAWRLALLLSVAADFVLGFLCWMESINICHEVTVSKRVKLNFRPGRDQPLMVKLPLYSVDNVKTRGGWGTACDHKSRGWLSRSTLGLLALVPLLFPQVPYCWHAYTHAQTKHVPCGLPFRLNTIFFISTVHALIPAWPERDDLRSEAKAKILLMLEVWVFLHCLFEQSAGIKQN